MGRLSTAFALYLGLSLLFFGREVIGDPNNRVVGDSGADKTLYMWSFEWWPRALLHWQNPLHVDVAWAPNGFDFGLGTAGGGLALAATPLTSLAGPVVTYNLLTLAAPALAGAAAFLLAQSLSGKFAPSLVAGYVFGFSSYELGHLLGHLPLAFTALVPLVPYLIVRRYRGDLSRRAFLALLAAVLVVQFLIVTQIFVTMVVVGVLAATVAAAILGVSSIRQTLTEAVVALILALVLISPVVAYAVVSDAKTPIRSPYAESADVLGYVIPTRRMLIRPPGSAAIVERFTATGAENGAYLGLPFLVLAALAAFRRPLARQRLLLAALLIGVVLLSLGARIKVAGLVVGIGPWSLLARLPFVDSALPIRLTMYAALFLGLLVAIALRDRTSVARWAAAVIGIVAMMPNVQLPTWSSDVPRPRFFATERYRQYVPERATTLVLPYGPAGWSMLWQAEADFRFRIIGGHFALRVTPSEERWRDVYEGLGAGGIPPHRLRAFLKAHDVDVVVVAPGTRGRVRRVVEAAVGSPPIHARDVLVYQVRAPPASE